jgi:cytochrome c peroxidase
MRIAAAMAVTLMAAVSACSVASPTDAPTTTTGGFTGMALPPPPPGPGGRLQLGRPVPPPPPGASAPAVRPSAAPTPPARPSLAPAPVPSPTLAPLPAHSPVPPAVLPVTEAALGRALFFDRGLSRDGAVSCASCHDPAKGYGDGRPTSVGTGGATGTRNAPTIRNASRQPTQFWDGRSPSLEAQALGPIQAANEMGLTLPQLEQRLQANPTYVAQFRTLYGSAPTSALFARAIAGFEHTETVTDDLAQRILRGDAATLATLTPQARAGQARFRALGCVACHGGPDGRDGQFHNLGVGTDRPNPDPGRFAVTGAPVDQGAFKTPTLINVADTAPYMHDGSLATLRNVVDFYDRGGVRNANLDRRMRPLGLTEAQKQELVAFLSLLKGTN